MESVFVADTLITSELFGGIVVFGTAIGTTVIVSDSPGITPIEDEVAISVSVPVVSLKYRVKLTLIRVEAGVLVHK